MQVNDLRYFQTIARLGNITAAARLLGARQPTLTVAIQRLEAEVGTTLFIRDRSGVTLTSTGKAFLQVAKDALAVLDVGVQSLQALETEEVGSFTLGLPGALGSYFLPTFFSSFFQTAPGIKMSLWTGLAKAVEQAVLARDVDFGLVINPASHPELVLTQLFHEAVDFYIGTPREAAPGVTPPAHALTLDWDTACDRLRAGPLIHVTRMTQARTMIEQLGAAGLLPAQQLQCGDLDLVKSLGIAGVGVAILPRRVAATDPLGRLQRLHPALPWAHDVVYLAYRADMHRTRAAMRLKDALVEHGRRLGADVVSELIQKEVQSA